MSALSAVEELGAANVNGAGTALLEPCLYVKPISLPRQARDKHGKVGRKKEAFYAGHMVVLGGMMLLKVLTGEPQALKQIEVRTRLFCTILY